ncbi:MAG TPA: hypothetical protein PK079_08315 [Leptospiraceae bacterium]|nr:hypothetical protein [Leptospiraceae bacterium]HMW06329.1 hypothetical protein [Leptospiraceae bacterium]HMX30992.1 hypothetical protein [Leptospiraceae bacterium]HMY32189.1 hypothetical protein [Leptospiraceae bacterium]HMZ63810.1 hypothetical protein [Leptospiraceae bacterium]
MNFRVVYFSLNILILFTLLYCSSGTGSNYKEVKKVDSFTGENVRDNEIIISSYKEKGLISVTGSREKFIFLLPYSEDWIVKQTDNSIVQLSSNDKNLIASISTERGSFKVDPEKFLRELKNKTEIRLGMKLYDTRVLSAPTNKILGYYIKLENKGLEIKSDNFWSIRQRPDDVILKLHLSMLNVSEEEIRKAEKILPIFMDNGFRILSEEDLEKL